MVVAIIQKPFGAVIGFVGGLDGGHEFVHRLLHLVGAPDCREIIREFKTGVEKAEECAERRVTLLANFVTMATNLAVQVFA